MDLAAKRAEIKRRLAGARPTGGAAFLRSMANTVADNATGLVEMLPSGAMPSATTVDVFRPKELNENGVINIGPVDVAGRAVRMLSGGRVDPLAAGRRYVADPVRIGDRPLGLPRGGQVVDAVLVAKDFATGDELDPRAAYAARQAEAAELADAFPVASTAGGIAGDIATLFTGRLPLTNRIAQAETKLAGLTARGGNQTLMRDISGLFTSDPMKTLYRGLGRTAETGLEGATLSIMKGGDPLEAAGYSAGAQAFGSAVLTGTAAFRKHPIWVSALTAGALYQIGREATPGGTDFVLPSIEAGFEHVWHGLLVGGLTALTGSRLRGADKSAVTRALGDLTTTAGRGTMLSVIADLTKEEDAGGSDVSRTLAHLAADPEVFNDTQLKRLTAAFEEQNFGETVADMLKTDPRFVRTVRSEVKNAGRELEEKKLAIKRRLGLVPEPPIAHGAR